MRVSAGKNERIRKRIKTVLRAADGLTTTGVARRVPCSRTTAILYLKCLKSEGICSFKEFGSAKVWQLTPAEVEVSDGA